MINHFSPGIPLTCFIAFSDPYNFQVYLAKCMWREHFWRLTTIILITGADPPSDVNAEQFGIVLSVTWAPPTTGATPTGCGLQWQLEQCDHRQWQCLTANIHHLWSGSVTLSECRDPLQPSAKCCCHQHINSTHSWHTYFSECCTRDPH